MLNRHFLRAKVLQLLYAFQINDCSDIEGHKKKLIDSFRHLVDLQTYLFSALMEFHSIAYDKMDDNKQKMLPTPEDLNPNLKFLENEFFKMLFEDKGLTERVKKLKINWSEEKDILKNIFKRFMESETYKNYMNSSKIDFVSERLIVVQLFKNYLISNEQFFDMLCEKRLEWESDYDIIAQNALKYLKEYEGKSDIKLDESFDIEFITGLFLNTINNDLEFKELIDSRIQNWDMDRVALMDVIIIKMGLAELIYCPEIPVNVTLNEYVELAKEFSTQKSKLFVNGLLDKLMVDLRAKGKIKKFETQEEEEIDEV
ncbi:MAG: transcription antitermination factor NusB [Bacteroidales bacterium]|nr:transcription antitermination factor NusB [Bacteroidales bacterium]MDD4684867.1 transcription antitermination factor NusB [Bacteroidales bacterium]